MKKLSFRLLLIFTGFWLLVSACSLSIPIAITLAPPAATFTPPAATLIPQGSTPTARAQIISTSTAAVLATLATATPTSTPGAPSTVGADGSGDPYFPQLGNGGYDVTHYTLDLAVDMDANTIRGAATIEAKTTQALSRFDLDYAGPTISAVSVDGHAATYTQQGGELVITPPALLTNGQAFTTVVTYSGQPGAALPPNTPAYSSGWNRYSDGVMVASEPQGQSAWYPLNETPADKAAYTFRITVAKPWVVAANGLQKSVTDNGDTRTYLWQTDNPVAPYLVTLGIAKFSEETDTSSDVLVRNFFGAGYPDVVKQDFARLPQMITYFESLFGPFPFEAYGVVAHNLHLNFSLETQTLTVFGNNFTNERVVSHELAHSWFGDSLTPFFWEDIWLNEGFASFGALMWQEHAAGKDTVKQDLIQAYQNLVRNEARNITIGNPGPDHVFDTQVYDRGELTLAALRARLGDDTFFKLLRTYAQRFYHANVTTHDFTAAAAEVSGQNLDAFFQAWLFQTQVPDIPELGLFRKDFK